MDEYPRMLYKDGGLEEIHGRQLSTFVVESASEERIAVSEGWRTTPAPADIAAPPRRGRPPKQRQETVAQAEETA